MKKFLTLLVTWGVIAGISAGTGAAIARLQFHFFTSQVVNPVPLEGKENALVNRLDQVVAKFATRAELEATKAGAAAGASGAVVVGVALALSEAAKKRSQLVAYRRYMEAKTLEMSQAFKVGNMERFTAIATEIAEQRGTLV
jgi:hypothetical protein